MAVQIFMLDDSVDMMELVRECVEKEGWQFRGVGTVQEALDFLEKETPDLILLDLHLPDGSGFQVCRGLRKSPRLSQTPVFFLTIREDHESRIKGFEAGAQDYVIKPFQPEELLARCRAHLNIKQKIDQLTREKQELAIRDRLRQDLVDMIVHDLTAPIHSIKMAMQILQESGTISDAENTQVLSHANHAAEFGLLMLNNLLDLGAGKAYIEIAPLDLASIGGKLRALFAPELKMRGIRIEMGLPKEHIAARTDGTILFRILANLVSNAVKYSPKSSAVSLDIQASLRGVRLQVEEQGPGIPIAEKTKIFDKYYRIKNRQSEKTSGMGIAKIR